MKRALLIGIDAYEDPKVDDLSGCVNDVELMAATLAASGFAEERMTKLTQAPGTTREGILVALDSLVASTAAGDTVVLYYSGHGSQVPDVNADEPDGLDETIVPSDGGRGTLPVRDIVDDELNGALEEIGRRTDRATFIFDSCNSGTISRILPPAGALDDTIAVRAVEAAATAPEGARPVTRLLAQGDRARRGIFTPGNYVLVTGCQPAQLSKETLYDGRRQGALTFFLTQELGRGGGRSVREIFEAAADGVRESVPDQDPTLEGPEPRLAASELF